ncbi:hypothetical protein [Xanthomonas vesicatoria]|uniref:hypothetical protein n=1 Tax=Xanthomonas vesicatoria TaxID=56460 RepID=UPI001E29AFA4|nr:hypothetical protein [Xanthomonas vesicatoria]MCC8627123.1 hypothetical protein [Xanthomonas vesicatoria]MDG4482700.1 hypothetical protein [Xanthomonas vesicatoria]
MTTDSTCAMARRHIQELHNRPDDDAVLRLVLERMIEAEPEYFPDHASYEAMVHLEACTLCQVWHTTWLDMQSPARVAQRERLGRYCCIHMFDAVTGLEPEVRFSFELFRGDPCWSINAQPVFARFCPWCARELPQHAFEQDNPL